MCVVFVVLYFSCVFAASLLVVVFITAVCSVFFLYRFHIMLHRKTIEIKQPKCITQSNVYIEIHLFVSAGRPSGLNPSPGNYSYKYFVYMNCNLFVVFATLRSLLYAIFDPSNAVDYIKCIRLQNGFF